jgi:hypothetical protein
MKQVEHPHRDGRNPRGLHQQIARQIPKSDRKSDPKRNDPTSLNKPHPDIKPHAIW